MSIIHRRNWEWHFNQNSDPKGVIDVDTFYEDHGQSFMDSDVVLLTEEDSKGHRHFVYWFDETPEPEVAKLIAKAPQLQKENNKLEGVLSMALIFLLQERDRCLENDINLIKPESFAILESTISDAKKLLENRYE